MWIRRRSAIATVAVIFGVVAHGAYATGLPAAIGEAHGPSKHSTPRDSELMTAVWHTIRTDQIVDPTTIEVTAEAGKITLSGMQPALVARDRATYLAETVVGVMHVDNRIIVQRGAREADGQKLESDVLYTLLTDPATARSSIIVAANADGHVDLSGTVTSYSERFFAEQLAHSVAGVRAVVNRITIEPPPSVVADRNLVASIQQSLVWDAYVRARDVHPSAKDGVVTLNGSVRTLAEKRRVVDLSWAAGARRVIANGLRVSAEAARTGAGTSASASNESDQAIVAVARRVLQSDPRLADCSIELNASNGIVTLAGTVPTLTAQRAAVWLVRGIRGVQSIADELRISDDALVFSDEEILLRIERALIRNSLTREDAIAVSVRNGAVVLEGEAHSWLARQFAEGAAASVMGVARISNQIEITGESVDRDGERAQLAASTGLWWIPGASPTAPVLVNPGLGIN